MGFFWVFRQSSCFNFYPHNRVHFRSFWTFCDPFFVFLFFFTPDKRVPECFFWLFRRYSCFNFYPQNRIGLLSFWNFCDPFFFNLFFLTPVKRVSEGFSFDFFNKIRVLIFTHKSEFVLHGAWFRILFFFPDKRVLEGFFWLFRQNSCFNFYPQNRIRFLSF